MKMPEYKHKEDGGTYRLLTATCMLKHPDTGEWLPGVVYEDVTSLQSYSTTIDRWNEKFILKAG